MAPNNATLNFVVKMQNQAQAALNSLGQGFRSLGQQAAGAGRGVNNLAIQLTGINQSAQLASQGLRGISQTVGANMEAFQRYDTSMNRVQRVTGQTAVEMDSFKKSFNSMAEELRTVDVGRLRDVAVQAAQLGIQGNDDIIQFTKTIGMLETSLSDLGDDAPKLMARVLAATGEGVDGIERFASVLVRMAKDASASEQVILEMTAQLGQSTAQFDVSAEALLALSTAASNLNFKPELFGTAIQRTLQQLNEASQQNTEGMRQLSEITGLTADEFNKLIASSPDQAFIMFLEVLKQLNAEGLSTASFLQGFNLQASENVRVLGAAAQNVDEFSKYLAQANAEASKPIALDQEFATALEAYAASTIEAKNAWEQFQAAVGEALAPIATAGLNLLSGALNGLTDMLRSMPKWLATVTAAFGVFLASIASIVPAILGIVGVLRLLGGLGAWSLIAKAGGWAISMAVGFGRLISLTAGLMRLGTVFSFLAGGIAAVVTAVGIVPVLIAAAIAGAVALGVAIYQNWDAVVKFLSQPIGDILAQTFKASVDAAVNGFWSILNGIKGAWNSFWSSSDMDIPKEALPGGLAANTASALKALDAITNDRQNGLAAQPNTVVSKVADEYQKVIEELDTQSEQLSKIIEQEFALRRLREVGADDPYRVQMGITDEDISRMERLVSFARIEANAVSAKMQALQEEAPMAAARTAAQRNAAEIEAAILEIIKQQGEIRAEDERMLRDQLGYLQQIRAVTALTSEMISVSNRVQSAQAVTREQQNQVALIQKRVELEDQYGEQLDEVAAILNTMAQGIQLEQFNSLEQRLDAVGAANRAFADDQYTLNQALESGSITMERYNQLMGMLARQTEDARNPYAQLIRSMREEIEMLGITGPYRDADREALQQVNQLKQQGVLVTEEMAVAMRDLYRATEDYRQSVEEGFVGWANQIKDTKGQILELQEAFAEGASSLLSDSLAGEEDALLGFIDNMKKRLLDAFSDAVIKNLLSGLDNNLNGLLKGTFGQPKDAATAALDKLNNMATGQMMVTAAAVYINGSGTGAFAQGLLGGGMQTPTEQGIPWSPANDNGAQAPWNTPATTSVPRMDPIGTFPQFGTMPTMPGNANGGYMGPFTPGYTSGSGADIGTSISTAIQPAVDEFSAISLKLDDLISQSFESLGVNSVDNTAAMDNTLTGTFDQLNSQRLTSELAALQMQLDSAAERAAATGQQFQQAGNQIQQAGQTASTATPTLGSMAGSIGNVNQQAGAAGQGLNGLGGILQQLLSSIGGTGAGGGGIGIIGGILGSLFHEGGRVGSSTSTRRVSPLAYLTAPRFHDGFANDEYPAILQRGERVLTAQQNSRTENVIAGLAANQTGGGSNITIGDINVTTQSTGDAANDERNAQMTAKAIDAMLEKKLAKWTTNQSRPGGMLRQG